MIMLSDQGSEPSTCITAGDVWNVDLKDKMDDPNQRIEIRIHRLFRCPGCGLNLPRKNVYKEEKDGKIIYRCNADHAEVLDITNTITGNAILEIVAL